MQNRRLCLLCLCVIHKPGHVSFQPATEREVEIYSFCIKALVVMGLYNNSDADTSKVPSFTKCSVVLLYKSLRCMEEMGEGSHMALLLLLLRPA